MVSSHLLTQKSLAGKMLLKYKEIKDLVHIQLEFHPMKRILVRYFSFIITVNRKQEKNGNDVLSVLTGTSCL